MHGIEKSTQLCTLSSAARAWLSENGESESADTRFQSWRDNQSQRLSVETHAAREVLRDNQAQRLSVETPDGRLQ